MTKTDLKALIRECLREELTLTESSLTSEEKVDAWHNGTRRENYRAAGLPKLTDFYNIAERKGYTDIVKIIEFKYDAIEFLSHAFNVDKSDIIKGTGKYIVVNYDTNMVHWYKFMTEQINSMVNYKIEF